MYDNEISKLLELDENKRLKHPEEQEDYSDLLRLVSSPTASGSSDPNSFRMKVRHGRFSRGWSIRVLGPRVIEQYES